MPASEGPSASMFLRGIAESKHSSRMSTIPAIVQACMHEYAPAANFDYVGGSHAHALMCTSLFTSAIEEHWLSYPVHTL